MPVKPFRKRNPVPIGAASILIILLILAASLNVQDLPLIGQGATYSARFSEAAGVQPDDDVRVAGVRVGKVTDLKLDRGDVVVSFKSPDAFIGDQSSASIEIKTVLGQKYIAIEPKGSRALDPDTQIPRARTRAPYDVITAFSDLSTTVQALNTDQIGQSLQVLSQTLNGAAGPIRPALDGLSRLSQTISSRDQQLGLLLANTRTTTQVLADRDAEIAKILSDGNLLLGELRSRKQAIDALLTGTQVLSGQLTGLVRDNEATLRPTLVAVNGVLTTLQQNSANLENGLRLLSPFIRVFNNVIGTGRWFDAYICNLDPPGDQACTPGSGPFDPTSLLGTQAGFADAVPNAVNRLGVPLITQGLNTPNLGLGDGGIAGLFPNQKLPVVPGVTFPAQVPDVLGATQANQRAAPGSAPSGTGTTQGNGTGGGNG